MVSSEISIIETNPTLEMVKAGGDSLIQEDCHDMSLKALGMTYAPEWWVDMRTCATVSLGFLGIMSALTFNSSVIATIATAATAFAFFGLSRVPFKKRMREMTHIPKKLDPFAEYEYLESSKWKLDTIRGGRYNTKKHYFAYKKEFQSGILEITVGQGFTSNPILDIARYSLNDSPELELKQKESVKKSKIDNPLLANMDSWDKALEITKKLE